MFRDILKPKNGTISSSNSTQSLLLKSRQRKNAISFTSHFKMCSFSLHKNIFRFDCFQSHFLFSRLLLELAHFAVLFKIIALKKMAQILLQQQMVEQNIFSFYEFAKSLLKENTTNKSLLDKLFGIFTTHTKRRLIHYYYYISLTPYKLFRLQQNNLAFSNMCNILFTVYMFRNNIEL